MAAYAALVSIMNMTEQIMDHPNLPASFDHKHIESLREIVEFLFDFIENYTSQGGSKQAQDLERQIASAAYAAEDVIESHVVDQIHAGFYPTSLLNLQHVIVEMESIKEKVNKVKEERGILRILQPTNPKSTAAAASVPASAKTAMVGFDEELIQLMEVLTGDEPSRQVFSVVGMGGIGKTTLARNAFENPLIVEHFDIRGWVAISHSYSVREIILQLLSCQEMKETLGASDREIDQESEDQLGLRLYQSLSGRKYLIVLDDIWSVESWDKIKSFFPDYGNRSRIVVTTRLSNVANMFSSSSFKLHFLDENKSWDLLRRTAFPQEDCPLELEQIGKEISQKCKGLPLSISVIGRVLGRSGRVKEYWETVMRDINLILRSDEDDLCLNLLSLSYSHLPAHLKPCFLYMGILQEDQEIHVSQLVKLFVAEGFLKPNKMQNLEEIAQDYLNDLVDRNLILVSKRRWNGQPKFYYIHDLLREICLREAEKEKFLHVMAVLDVPRGIDMAGRRVVFHDNTSEHPQVFNVLQSAALVRSLILKGGPLPFKLQLLKVLSMVDSDSLEVVFQQVNLRYLLYAPSRTSSALLPSSTSLLWSVQTLIFKGTERIVAPPEIWKMKHLRHLKFDKICLPELPASDTTDQQKDCVLQNLQTLANVVNCNFSENICERIPNIRKLGISYDDFSDNCLNVDLGSLHKLQSVKCCLHKEVDRGDSVLELTFPSSVQKLSLIGCCLHWDKVTTIGMMLPHLEYLELDSVVGREWNLVEGAFPRLKFLSISNSELMYWTADNSRFPILEQLHLRHMHELDQIPLDIGDIPTLRYLNLFLCSEPSVISSVKILEEQLSFGNEDIAVQVSFEFDWEINRFKREVDIENFPKQNFHCTSMERFRALQEKIRVTLLTFSAAMRFRRASGQQH